MPRFQLPHGPVHDRGDRNLLTQAAAWVAAGATTGAILARHNVKTFTRTASGTYTITWDRPFSLGTAAGINQPPSSYCVQVSWLASGQRVARVTSVSGTFVVVGVHNFAGGVVDVQQLYVTAFGTLR